MGYRTSEWSYHQGLPPCPPLNQGGYIQGGYIQGGYIQGGYIQGGYIQGGYILHH